MSTAIASIRSGLPPGPKGTIVGGNSRQFRARLLDFLWDTARDYGPLASFRVGPRRVFLSKRTRPHRTGPGDRCQTLHQALRSAGVQARARKWTRYERGRALPSTAQAYSTRVPQGAGAGLRSGHGRADRANARLLEPEQDGSDQ